MISKHRFVAIISFLALVSTQCKNPIDRVIDNHIDIARKQILNLVESCKVSDTLDYNPVILLNPSKYQDGKVFFCYNEDWVSGFFPGSLWYMYALTGEVKWADNATLFTNNIENYKNLTSHHDVGFIINSSFGNGLEFKHLPNYSDVVVAAARSLATRFRPVVGVFQSWDADKGWQALRGWSCPVIIDNMMNLELLFKAAEISGDMTFFDMAVAHADKTLSHHFRPDHSCCHVVDYDILTGEVRGKYTAQGYSDDSSWARGQAWALYGYTMSYRFTGYDRYLEQAVAIENFIFNNPSMPEDLIPYWDFDAPENIAGHPRDVSSATIIASALYELYGYTQNKRYLDEADSIISTLTNPKYRAAPGTNGGFILMHSTASVPHNSGIDVSLNYADYYLLEALYRRKTIKG